MIAFNSDDGRDAVASLIFLAIALGDLLDGFVARATGQYSRLGALLDPVVDRLTILAGAVVCWHFELLPRWAIALLAVREVATLVLARYGLRHGVDLEITWVGRIAVFLIMGGIFWSMVFDWEIIGSGSASASLSRSPRRCSTSATRPADEGVNAAAAGAVQPAFNLQVLIDPSTCRPIIATPRFPVRGTSTRSWGV